ncbi:TPM domain-containing protein [Agrilutibacter solisilvae]|uniref:TPM domain-containing protein n=1 Tax=Agrilutibacter solisilvae TaxID=2763317 RepID=A0A974Y561_9GAMM|nr:TPM domain-containing protein [Lysobacter solisilvae]QSX78466.1 TPM domain-containing protein [Lysobacter solisilvae]
MTGFARALHAGAMVALLACAPALAAAQTLAAVPPLTGPVIDTTASIDAMTRSRLEAQAVALQQRKGSQLQVLVVPTTQPEDIAQYAVRAYETYRLGRKGVDDGLLLVVAKDDRRARIEVGYGLEGAIPDATAIRVINEYLVPKFRAGDFGGGLLDATGTLVKLVDGEPLPAPMAATPRGAGGEREGGNWLFGLFAAFIVAQVARGFLNPVPKLVRGVLGGAAAGGVAWMLSSLALVGGIGALIGLFVGLLGLPSGRYAGNRGWGGFGGGGFGGGGFGGGGFGGGGGGWSGGGGMSGGGGASGSW